LLAVFAAAPVNHVLRGESWALRRLMPYAGKTAAFDAVPFAFSFTVRDDGTVAPAVPGIPPDATFRITMPAALRLLAGDERAYDEVVVNGDAEFAEVVAFVVRNARWDLEEDLARIFGDVAAHRLVGTGRSVLRLQARAAASVAHNLAEYWTEERPLIARRSDVSRFVDDVDALRDDLERLAQRIARLST